MKTVAKKSVFLKSMPATIAHNINTVISFTPIALLLWPHRSMLRIRGTVNHYSILLIYFYLMVFLYRPRVFGHCVSHNYAAFLGFLQAFFLACDGVRWNNTPQNWNISVGLNHIGSGGSFLRWHQQGLSRIIQTSSLGLPDLSKTITLNS